MLTIAAVISVLGVVIAGMLAYNYNRSVIGYVLLSLVLTPVLTIVTLLVLGERNINFMINDKRDQVTPEPEKVIPEEQEELKVEVQMQVNVHNALDESDPKVNVTVVPLVNEVKPKAAPKSTKAPKNTKTTKKARYTKGKNKTKSKMNHNKVHDHTSHIITAATTAAIVTPYISSADTGSYDSSSCDSSSSSSSGSCD
ncbi:UNVERIFIED_ORG: hypothetical protein [Escherichia phage CMSTMSU]